MITSPMQAQVGRGEFINHNEKIRLHYRNANAYRHWLPYDSGDVSALA